eukprot:4400074-Prymnesium_polylepis.1
MATDPDQVEDVMKKLLVMEVNGAQQVNSANRAHVLVQDEAEGLSSRKRTAVGSASKDAVHSIVHANDKYPQLSLSLAEQYVDCSTGMNLQFP